MASRSYSLFKTLGGTAVRAGTEKIKKQFGFSQDEGLPPSAAMRLVEGLDELKGAAMKLGQMLSLLADEDILPEGWGEVLAKLQSSATPRPWEEIQPILIEQLGNLDAFEKIDPEAVHSASIGQVHQAWLKSGEKVAVKVRYPDLEEWINSDISMMTKAFRMAKILPNSEGIDDLAHVVQEVIRQELDFSREKYFYQYYREKFKNYEEIIVPKVIDPCCTARVLTTEWVNGQNIYEWIQQYKPSFSEPDVLERRNHVGHHIMIVMLTELFEFQCIQSDPNPANFLVTDDDRIVLLDFGATQVLSPHVVDNYRKLCTTLVSGSREKMKAVCFDVGFLIDNDSEEARNLFVDMMEIIAEPFRNPSYSWENCKMTKRINQLAIKFSVAVRFRPPPHDIVFLNRRLAGNQILMEKLGPTLEIPTIFNTFDLTKPLKESINPPEFSK